MSGHTPGPWSWGDDDSDSVVDSHGLIVADLFGDNREANSRLVAAAPDAGHAADCAFVALIAKAEGRE